MMVNRRHNKRTWSPMLVAEAPQRIFRAARPAARHAARFALASTVLALAACPALAADPHREGLTVPVAGEPFSGRLVRIDGDGNVTLEAQGQERTMAMADIVRWGAYRESDDAARVVLRDGSVLVADVMELDETSISVESGFWPSTTIARNDVAGMVFAPPATTRARDRLLRTIHLHEQSQDLVLLKNGDRIAGRLAAAPAGEERDGDFGLRAFGMTLRGQGGTVAVSAEDTVAVLQQAGDRAATRAAPRIRWLGFRDGSLLAVETIEVQAPHVSLVLSCGQRLRLPAEELWEDVCLVQPLGSTARYLSDLSPIGYQHSPFLELQRPLERDRNVLGGQLRTAGSIRLKGLGMPTTSRAVYAVSGGDRRFAAELALDDDAGPRGSVVFRVFLERQQGDSEAAWQAAYTSPIVRGGDAPRPISVELAGATKIALIVDFSDGGDACDYANWLDARFLP